MNQQSVSTNVFVVSLTSGTASKQNFRYQCVHLFYFYFSFPSSSFSVRRLPNGLVLTLHFLSRFDMTYLHTTSSIGKGEGKMAASPRFPNAPNRSGKLKELEVGGRPAGMRGKNATHVPRTRCLSFSGVPRGPRSGEHEKTTTSRCASRPRGGSSAPASPPTTTRRAGQALGVCACGCPLFGLVYSYIAGVVAVDGAVQCARRAPLFASLFSSFARRSVVRRPVAVSW